MSAVRAAPSRGTDCGPVRELPKAAPRWPRADGPFHPGASGSPFPSSLTQPAKEKDGDRPAWPETSSLQSHHGRGEEDGGLGVHAGLRPEALSALRGSGLLPAAWRLGCREVEGAKGDPCSFSRGWCRVIAPFLSWCLASHPQTYRFE